MTIVDLFSNGCLCGDRYKDISDSSYKLAMELYHKLINYMSSNCKYSDCVNFGEDLISEIVSKDNSDYINIIEKAFYKLKSNGIIIEFNEDSLPNEFCFKATGWEGYPKALSSNDYKTVFWNYTGEFIRYELENYTKEPDSLEDKILNDYVIGDICQRLVFLSIMDKISTKKPSNYCDIRLKELKSIAKEFDFLKYIEDWTNNDFGDFIYNEFVYDSTRFDKFLSSDNEFVLRCNL